MSIRTVAEDKLRHIATGLFAEGVAAADPAMALRHALAETPFPQPAPGGKTHLIAIGKAAPAMLNEALKHLRGAHTALCVTHHENDQDVPGATLMRAGHPVPDQAGLDAGLEIQARLAAAGAEDCVIALISGGGSALAPAPVEGLSLQDKAAVNQLLLSSGLDIVQMNLVRQNLSRLKGGGFLRLAAPAPVQAYLLSDVIGDDLRAIASGPTVAPIGTAAEARAVLEKAGIWEALPDTARTYLENAPAQRPPLPPVSNRLIGSNRHSLAAMLAHSGNWQGRIVSDALEGDVAEAAQIILDAARSAPRDQATALFFGGETTVKLTGTGRGGRNQDLALRVALAAEGVLQGDWLFLSGGTDGRDGPTDAAGGLVNAGTLPRIRRNGGDPEALLANNDSYAALTLADDLLMTGATGTNVADLQILLLQPL